MIEEKRWWHRRFRGNLRIMTWEIVLSLLVGLGLASTAQTQLLRLLLFPFGFVLTLAVLLRATCKNDRSELL